MSMKRNFVWLLSARIISSVLMLASAMLINRSLGPESRGVFAEMQTWAQLMFVLFNLSMDTGVYSYASRVKASRNEASGFVTTAIVSLMLAAIAGAILALIVTIWPDMVSSGTSSYLSLLILLILLMLPSSNLLVFFQALGHMRLASVSIALQALVSFVFVAWAYIFGFLDLKMAMIFLVAFQTVPSVAILVAALRGGLLTAHFDFQMALGMLRAGLILHVGTVSSFLYSKANLLMLFNYKGEAATGLFAVALTLSLSAMIIPMTAQQVLYPRVLHADDDMQVTMRVCSVALWGWGLCVIVMALLARPMIMFYAGDKYLDAVPLFQIMLVSTFFLPLSSIFAPLLIKKGAFALMSISGASLAIIGLVINNWLISDYGEYGAAVATSSVVSIGFFMLLLILKLNYKADILSALAPPSKVEIAGLFRSIRK